MKLGFIYIIFLENTNTIIYICLFNSLQQATHTLHERKMEHHNAHDNGE